MIVFVLNDTQTPAARLTVRTAELLLPGAEIVPLAQPVGGKLNDYLRHRNEEPYMLTIPSGAELLRSFSTELSHWLTLMKEQGLKWLRIQPAQSAQWDIQVPEIPHAVTIWTPDAIARGEINGFAEESELPFNHYTDYDKYIQIREACPGAELLSSSFRPAPRHFPAWMRRREEWEALAPLLEAPAVPRPHSKPLLSVVICAYNAAAHLPWAIRSVLKQTSSAWELILVDDASNDGTDAAIERLVPLAHNVTVIRHEHNRGKAASLNTALVAARGSWLLELDADDWLTCDAVARFAEAAVCAEDSVALICGNYGEWLERSPHQLLFRKIHVTSPIKDVRQLLENARPLIPRLYRVSTLRQEGGWRQSDPFYGRLYEDMEMLIRLLRSYEAEYLPHCLYHRRLRSSSMSRKHAKAYAAWKLWALASFEGLDHR
ncbi:glycosyltransferase family 2 protein [Paenibacillus sp. GCM10012307]|uniref:Glycosyltransferase family 2 protein n=1 Tax=Paenibacillus roseus TaxID=2798579 RepID=A0A934J4B9_9BACL|nr:glycosyltransferase family A protein [Paenibacillus roseus]MBJ6363044.1 glycosyltransferase family 2 protein [Paenibacillus roseus]